MQSDVVLPTEAHAQFRASPPDPESKPSSTPPAPRLYRTYKPLLLSGRGFGPEFDGAIFDLLLVSPPSGEGNRILVEGLRTIAELKGQPEEALLEIVAEQRKQLATPEHRLETLIAFVEQRFSHSDAMPFTRADLDLLEDDYFRLTGEEQQELTVAERHKYNKNLGLIDSRKQKVAEFLSNKAVIPEKPAPATVQTAPPATEPPTEELSGIEENLRRRITELETEAAARKGQSESERNAVEESSRLRTQLAEEEAKRKKAEAEAGSMRAQLQVGTERENSIRAQAKKALETATSAKQAAEQKAAELVRQLAEKIAAAERQAAEKDLEIKSLQVKLAASKEEANSGRREAELALRTVEERAHRAQAARDEALQGKALAEINLAGKNEEITAIQAEIDRLSREIAELRQNGRTEDKILIQSLSAQLSEALAAKKTEADIQPEAKPNLIPKVLKDQFLTGEIRTHLTSAVTRLLILLDNPPAEGEAARLVKELLSGKLETAGSILGRIITNLSQEEGKAFAENLAPIWRQIEINARKLTLKQILELLNEELSQGQIEIQSIPDL